MYIEKNVNFFSPSTSDTKIENEKQTSNTVVEATKRSKTFLKKK